MRNGNEIKKAINTTLQKTWVAAKTGIHLRKLDVRFYGEQAYMTKKTINGVEVLVNLPDFLGTRMYPDETADRILGFAIHEIGHGFFTDVDAWNNYVAIHGHDALLHLCINAFEDVRMERATINSGYVVGAKRLFNVVLKHITKDTTPEGLAMRENIPYAICIEARHYETSIRSLIPDAYLPLIDASIKIADKMQTCNDAIAAGDWLWKQISNIKRNAEPQKQNAGQSEDQSENQSEGQNEKEGESKTPGGNGKGNQPGKLMPIEPEVFSGIKLEPEAFNATESVVDGEVTPANEYIGPTPSFPPALASLQFDLRQLLDNTDRDESETHLVSGRLTRQWTRIMNGDENVFKRRNIVDGMDSAVVIAVDQSGSMSSMMHGAAQAAGMIGQALQRCPGVRWTVRGFETGPASTCASGIGLSHDTATTAQRARWHNYKDFNESWGTFMSRYGYLFQTGGGTPDLAAMTDVIKTLSARREPRKVCIWIGDGNGYNAASWQALHRKYPNVITIGIGIGVSKSFRKVFHHSVIVNRSEDIAKLGLKTVLRSLRIRQH